MRLIIAILFGLMATAANAQDSLSLAGIIDLALAHNHGIKVARNEAAMADNSATIGNAGLLPRVDLNGAYTYSLNNTSLEFAGGIPPSEVDGATSTNLSGSIGMSYTLFDGLGTIYNYQKLQTAGRFGEASARLTIENTVIQVLNLYYAMAQLQGAVATTTQALNISRERHQRLQTQYEYGKATKLQVLNAEVDLNTDSLNLINAQLNLDNARRNINALIGNKAPEDFAVEKAVAYRSDLSLQALQQEANNNNAALLLAAQSMELARLDVKSSQSTQYPRLALNASYGYNRSQSDASIILDNQNVGFTGGLSLSFNLFDGRRRQTALQNARIQLENSRLREEEAKLQVQRDVSNAWFTYQTRLAALVAEQTAVQTAQRNFDRTTELFGLGQITGTQFREAQINLVRTQNRMNDARFLAKLSELECLRVAGLLLKP